MSSQHAVQEGPPRLWVEAFGFGRRRLRGDEAVPWHDPAALPAFHHRLEEMLRPDVLSLPVGDFFAAWSQTAPAAPGRKRPGAALKAMLSADGPRDALVELLAAVGDRRPAGIEIPAPSAWAVWAEEQAGEGAIDPSEVRGRAASYVANFLRSLGDANIGHVLVGGPEGVDPAELEPLVRVAEHYRWLLGTHGGGGAAHFAVTTVPDTFWHDDGSPAGDPPFHLRVPADAEPDLVLDRLAVLREGALR